MLIRIACLFQHNEWHEKNELSVIRNRRKRSTEATIIVNVGAELDTRTEKASWNEGGVAVFLIELHSIKSAGQNHLTDPYSRLYPGQ